MGNPIVPNPHIVEYVDYAQHLLDSKIDRDEKFRRTLPLVYWSFLYSATAYLYGLSKQKIFTDIQKHGLHILRNDIVALDTNLEKILHNPASNFYPYAGYKMARYRLNSTYAPMARLSMSYLPDWEDSDGKTARIRTSYNPNEFYYIPCFQESAVRYIPHEHDIKQMQKIEWQFKTMANTYSLNYKQSILFTLGQELNSFYKFERRGVLHENSYFAAVGYLMNHLFINPASEFHTVHSYGDIRITLNLLMATKKMGDKKSKYFVPGIPTLYLTMLDKLVDPEYIQQDISKAKQQLFGTPAPKHSH